MAKGSDIIRSWPEESREPAQLVIDQYGEPDEAAESALIWHRRGQWKRIVATKTFYPHNFPVPHHDSVESFIDYRVPAGKFSDIAAYDGSVITERTAGEASARAAGARVLQKGGPRLPAQGAHALYGTAAIHAARAPMRPIRTCASSRTRRSGGARGG